MGSLLSLLVFLAPIVTVNVLSAIHDVRVFAAELGFGCVQMILAFVFVARCLKYGRDSGNFVLFIWSFCWLVIIGGISAGDGYHNNYPWYFFVIVYSPLIVYGATGCTYLLYKLYKRIYKVCYGAYTEAVAIEKKGSNASNA